MTWRSRGGWILPLLLVVPLGPTSARAACDDTELCRPDENPCVVNRARCIAPGTTIDVRPRTLLVNKRITIGEGTDAVFIRAGEVVVGPSGAFEVTGETGTLGRGGELHLEATGRISLQESGTTRARIDANGSLEGGIVVLHAGDNMIDLGTITANATSTVGTGGLVLMTSDAGYVWIGTGGVSATGGSNGSEGASGGEIAISAATTVLVEGPVDASNGDCFGCVVSAEARGGDVTLTPTAVVSVSASGGFGDGGSVVLDAGGAVTVDGTVRAVAKGSGGEEEGGAGTAGTLDVVALHDVRIAGEVDLSGAGPDGDAGRVDVDAAGALTIPGRIRLDTDGTGFGGDAFLVAESFELTGEVSAHADDFGGSVDVLVATTALIGGTVTASGSWRSGTIDVEACALSLSSAASLTTTGGPALGARGVTLSGGDSLTVGGDVTSTGPIRLAYRASPPLVLPGASITPSPELFLDEGLACCGSCPASTTSTSTSSSSTSSSTSSVSSTISSTSSTSSSSSTSTSASSTSSSSATSTSASSTSTTTSTSATSSSSVTTSTASTASSSSSSSSSSTSSTSSTTTSSTTTSSSSPTSSTTSTSSTSTSTTTLAGDPCDVSASVEERVRCKMGEAGVLLEAEEPTSNRGVRRVRQLRKWTDRIDARLATTASPLQRERALRFTARLLRRMHRHVTLAARRGDVSATLVTLLPPLLAETQAIVESAPS